MSVSLRLASRRLPVGLRTTQSCTSPFIRQALSPYRRSTYSSLASPTSTLEGSRSTFRKQHLFRFNKYLYYVVPTAGLLLAFGGPNIQFSAETNHLAPTEQEPIPSDALSTIEDRPRRTVLSLLNDYILEPFLTGLRFLHLAGLFLPVIFLVPVTFFGQRERLKNGEKGDRSGAIWWYKVLVKQMERAGPSFIKLAQWAGSRSDLFPAHLCEALGQLHSNGKPHSFRHTRRVIEHVFQKPFEEVFEHFDDQPIGCGAIAQVYKATLRPEIVPPSYREPKKRVPSTPSPVIPTTTVGIDLASVPHSAVAIKILHPRVHQTIARDLRIMGFFASVLNAFPGMEWLSFPDEVKVFGEMMNQQLDLTVEASNLSRFEENFQLRRTAISFPRPVRDFSTKDVLVEEFENALPLKYFLRNGGAQYDDQLANMGLDAFLNMLLLDNWTHGDLHPGNIMVKFFRPTTSTMFSSLWKSIIGSSQPASPSANSTQAANESDEIVARLSRLSHDKEAWLAELDRLYMGGWQPELVFIDAGLVTHLDDLNRRNFLDLFQAVAEFDGYKAGKLMVERCRTPHLVIDEENFALKIQHLVLSVKSKTFSLAQIKISDILTEVLSAVRRSHVKMEGDFVNTVISILLLEGIGRQLDPNMDLFKSALPILRQLGRQMGTREAIGQVPGKDLGAMIKIWVWLEARDLISASIVDTDTFIKYDRLMPNI
ncbi:abc1-domain-containing protein [Phaffia rhodozyma]|uniref:Abc1-domain-containing protein n=1 Tax=Phaffia rhodozyma TaxID=264483 RepID=A0A0F7SGB9_PHARH|nr:abc1-domain-containing protein [Phaffia rhodozyma]